MNPLLIDVPHSLETDRLTLRVPRAGDGELVFKSVRESLAQLKAWMVWAKDDYSLENSEEWCRRCAADFIEKKQIPFIILLKSGEHIGNLCAFALDWEIPKGEIGYWLRTRFTGQGYMTEAVQAIVRLLMDGLKVKRVELRSDEKNEPSCDVAERCGFALEGTLRSDFKYPDGRLRSTRVYSRVAGA
jgi:RimJ/RimL family protein N-acetyltransferase